MEFLQQAMDHIGGNLLNIGDSLESRNAWLIGTFVLFDPFGDMGIYLRFVLVKKLSGYLGWWLLRWCPLGSAFWLPDCF